ncbi:MAG: putative Methyltransferase [Candidatus Saccharibacteria bacterium]|nr:putative Methyltransferase [Candidatus Saccharibacteria bacterium]
MRVITGSLGGRTFDSPRGHRTHPMGDKIRGALFNILGDISGLTVLDAFSGSGALSIEAISRGAESAVAIDIDKEAYETIQANVEALQLKDKITVLRKNVAGWSRNNQAMTFDIVLADPPYNDIRPVLLQKLIFQTKEGGIFVLSWPGSEPVRKFDRTEVLTAKSYGDAQLVFYRRTQ